MRPALGSLLAAALAAGAAFAQAPPPAAPAAVHHELDVSFVPATGLLRVTAKVTLPAGTKPELLLNGALKVTRSSPALKEVPLGDVAAFFGNNAAATEPSRGKPPAEKTRSESPANRASGTAPSASSRFEIHRGA